MIKVKFILVEDENNEEIRTVLEERVFENAVHWYDSIVDDYVYKTVIKLDTQYDFIDWQNAPTVEILYYNDSEHIVYSDDCTDYMFNL